MFHLADFFRPGMPSSSPIMAVRRRISAAGRKLRPFLPLPRLLRSVRRFGRHPVPFYRGIRFRLVLFVLLLLGLTTLGVSAIVVKIMDQGLVESLIARGSAITQAIATPAGFSLMTSDRLALDNLVAQIQQGQKELIYAAILDREQHIVAHNRLDRVGKQLPPIAGTTLETRPDLIVRRGLHAGEACYEFRRAILFSGRHVGEVVVGIGAGELTAAERAAHRQIYLLAALALLIGLIGALFLASVLIRPVEQLTDRVSRMQRGDAGDDIPIRSRDELGVLTRNFNRMAKRLQRQQASLREYAAELETSYNDMVRVLAAALDARDTYTYGHSARVAQLALALAGKLELDQTALQELGLACLLHDIGKIHVPDAILNKKAQLDANDLQKIVRHPQLGAQILALAPSLHRYIPAVKHHHERYDGTGYPDRLRGEAIPLQAQIVALADTYDAITSSRPYRKGLSRSAAIAEILAGSGNQFNPDLIEPFIEVVCSLPEEDLADPPRPEQLCAS